MGKKGDFDYSYNGRISVDEDNRIIVGEHLTQNADDKKEVDPALEEIKVTTGGLPEKMSLDNSYMSGDNPEAFEDEETDVYIATGKGEKKDRRGLDETRRKIKKTDFIFDEEEDSFICPAGCTLKLKRESNDGKKIYQGDKAECDVSPYKARCCSSEKGLPRTVSSDAKEPLRQKMNKKTERESSKEIYKKRKKIVEPVFGQIKNKGFRGFSLRGYKKASGEFSLVCAVHNLKKILKAVSDGKVCLESGKSVPKLA